MYNSESNANFITVAGGTTVQPITETLSLTDSASTNPTSLTETISLTDSITKNANILLSDTISLTYTATGLPKAVFPGDWNKKLLSTNSTLVSGSSDLANFPVLVTLTNDPDLTSAKVGGNGQGIRFTSDGTTAVPFEIESYDQGTRTLVAWVKLTVDHDDDTRFYIHYDQTEAISPDPAANVWTNYVAVNHLHSTPDPVSYTHLTLPPSDLV